MFRSVYNFIIFHQFSSIIWKILGKSKNILIFNIQLETLLFNVKIVKWMYNVSFLTEIYKLTNINQLITMIIIDQPTNFNQFVCTKIPNKN